MPKILPRIWANSSDGLIQYVSLTKNKLEEAVQVVRRGFFMSEKLCVAVGLSEHPEAIREFDDLVIYTAMDGVSVTAEEKATGKVIGCALNKIHVKCQSSEEFFKNFKCKHPSGQAFLELNAEIDRRVNAFDLLKTNCYVEHIIVGILPEFRSRGIGGKLHQTSCKIMERLVNGENVKEPLSDKPLPLDPIPTAGLGYTTTTASKNLAFTSGFTQMAEIDLSNYVFKNELLSGSVISKIPSISVFCSHFKKF